VDNATTDAAGLFDTNVLYILWCLVCKWQTGKCKYKIQTWVGLKIYITSIDISYGYMIPFGVSIFNHHQERSLFPLFSKKREKLEST
jgi:hypothetical protein